MPIDPDPDVTALLTEVFEEVWVEIQSSGDLYGDPEIARQIIAGRLMKAAREGERNRATLKAAALATAKAH